VGSITPLTFCPLKYLNMIGLKVSDLSPLLEMSLKTLCISPLELSEEEFTILKQLDLEHLVGPGDPEMQTVSDFMQKYSHSNAV